MHCLMQLFVTQGWLRDVSGPSKLIWSACLGNDEVMFTCMFLDDITLKTIIEAEFRWNEGYDLALCYLYDVKCQSCKFGGLLIEASVVKHGEAVIITQRRFSM